MMQVDSIWYKKTYDFDIIGKLTLFNLFIIFDKNIWKFKAISVFEIVLCITTF